MRAERFGNQHTLTNAVSCEGVGLHSGAPVKMTLRPAAAGAGIVFVRSDVPAGKGNIPAQYDRVTETRLGTTITNEMGVSLSTIEHVMAALWGCGVDNVTIEVNGPEIPIMDGSSEPFVFLVENAGIREQVTPRQAIEILKPVYVQVGNSSIRLEPYNGYVMDVEIAFDHEAISRQHSVYDFSKITFQNMLSRARTFGFEHEVEQLRAAGLARGGSLHNAIVIGKEGVLNREGLRFSDEFVRHKALDCIGDLYLAGAPILGRVVAKRPGHGINNQVLRALFADQAQWRMTSMVNGCLQTPSLAAREISVGAGVSGALHE